MKKFYTLLVLTLFLPLSVFAKVDSVKYEQVMAKLEVVNSQMDRQISLELGSQTNLDEVMAELDYVDETLQQPLGKEGVNEDLANHEFDFLRTACSGPEC
ncbi:MAG: hypothetical protein KDD40_12990 [Bdellovibrionales bacterium]|nr:hypothetical protein [Bdellovibrionales bacterium]